MWDIDTTMVIDLSFSKAAQLIAEEIQTQRAQSPLLTLDQTCVRAPLGLPWPRTYLSMFR